MLHFHTPHSSAVQRILNTKNTIMGTYDLKLHSSWEEAKEKLKEVNTDLTDEDLEYNPGQEKQLLERLAIKLNKDVPAVKAWVESVSYNSGIAS